MDISKLAHQEKRLSRSISPENPTGEKGRGGLCPLEAGMARKEAQDLGVGWKVNPNIVIAPHESYTIADISGEGCIDHIWITPMGRWRDIIIRMYWEDQAQPSVECPLGDFFCMGWNRYAQLSSLAVCVNPGCAFNCYWPMPFRRRARITLENLADTPETIFYQIDYCLREVNESEMYFHAQFRRVNPLPYKEVYTILDGVRGQGKYVGTYLAWGVHNNGWWGEGEIKFYMDGDQSGATICGTGTEDYFCGSYNFEDPDTHADYKTYCTPYTGLHQVITPDRLYNSQMRFGMYRWHITDPICFEQDLRITIQALGWRSGRRYMPLCDDIASVAYWYQKLPAAPFPELPDRDYLEVV